MLMLMLMKTIQGRTFERTDVLSHRLLHEQYATATRRERCIAVWNNKFHRAQSLRSSQPLSSSRNSPPFMEPEGLLPCSQKSANGSNPELVELNPQPHT